MIDINQENARKCLLTLINQMKKDDFYPDLEESYQFAIDETFPDYLNSLDYPKDAEEYNKVVEGLAKLMNDELIQAVENHCVMNAKQEVINESGPTS